MVGEKCPQCQVGTLIKKEGISKATGQPFRFIGCDMFPKCKYIYRPELKPKTEGPPVGSSIDKKIDRILIIMQMVYQKLNLLESKLRGTPPRISDKDEEKS